MTNPAKDKGDKAELEVQEILSTQLDLPIRRALGAGRKDDVGDMFGMPYTAIQVANWTDVLSAIRHKVVEVEQQRKNAGAKFAASFIRLSRARVAGSFFVVVMTPKQFTDLWKYARIGYEMERRDRDQKRIGVGSLNNSIRHQIGRRRTDVIPGVSSRKM